MMRRILPAAAALLLGLALAPAAARAQMPAEALGKSLPDASLPDGTITVRVFKGSPSAPMEGLVVNLTSDSGEQRNARTDKAGRARFPNLPPGTTWVAKVTYEKNDTESDPIALPPKGGMRTILSPVPWNAQPTTGDGRPPPTKMASRARPEQSVPAGALRVLLVGGSWDRIIGNHLIHLVGLRADGQISHHVATTDAGGHVVFQGLRGRDVAYYALTLLDQDGRTNRLMSTPTQLLPRVGMTMALSGAPKDADKAEDDLDQFYWDQPVSDDDKLPPGTAQIRIVGDDAVGKVSEIELVEASKPGVATKAPARDIQGRVEGEFVMLPKENASNPAGSLVVGVLRNGQNMSPVKDIDVEVLPKGATQPIVAKTDKRGAAEFPGLQAGTEYTITVVMNGTRIEGKPFTLSDKAGMVAVAALAWDSQAKQAEFSGLPWGPDKVYVARTTVDGRVYVSPPFQLTSDRGAIVPLPVVGKNQFRFRIQGQIEDEFLFFHATLAMTNGPVAPTSLGHDVSIPLPRGFLGARLSDDTLSSRVRIIPHEGLVWKGAIPPGGFQFDITFSLKAEDGSVRFDWDLPYGAAGSQIWLQWLDSMEINLAGQAEGKISKTDTGIKVYQLNGLNIPAQQRMVWRVRGLPQNPGWYKYVRWIIGAVVILIGVWLAVILFGLGRRTSKSSQQADRAARRDRLLTELANVERKHAEGKLPDNKYESRKKRLIAELEPLYDRPEGG